MNPGVGDLYIGGMWLAAIIVDTPDVPISVSDALTSQYIGSPQCNLSCHLMNTQFFLDRAPEMANSTKLTTKVCAPTLSLLADVIRWIFIHLECVS